MIGYTGYRGEGKTLTCVHDIWGLWQRNPYLIVLTNTPLYFPNHKDTGEPLRQIFWRDIMELQNFFAFAMTHEDTILKNEFLVFIDEANLVMPSRLFAKLPEFMLSFMAQSRKFNTEIFFTTQHPQRVDKILRELTENWVQCKRVFPKLIPQLFSVNHEVILSNEGLPIENIASNIFWRPTRFYAYYDTYFKVSMPKDITPDFVENDSKMLDFLDAYLLDPPREGEMNTARFERYIKELDDFLYHLTNMTKEGANITLLELEKGLGVAETPLSPVLAIS